MIDPHWNVVDLDPTTWRNLGPYLEVAQYIRTPSTGEAELYVLHDDGRVLKVYDTQAGKRSDVQLARVENPEETARTLFATENWGRVHVINKRHLADVARQAQQIENRPLTLDEYYRLVFDRLWNNHNGYVSQPPHPGNWNGWTYTDALAFVHSLPDPASVALGVLDKGELFIGLILEVKEKLIRTVTTFEALDLAEPLNLNEAALAALERSINEKFAPLAAALLCDRATFEGWIAAEDKSAYLKAAAQARKAFWIKLF